MSTKPSFSFVFIIIAALMAMNCAGTRNILLPGSLEDGRVRLPNGWLLNPAGRHLPIGELPMNMVLTADERTLIVGNNGTGKQSLTVIDLPTWKVVQTVNLNKSWLGLRLFNHDTRLLVSGGNDNRVDIYAVENQHLALIDSVLIGKPWPDERIWIGGIDVDGETGTAFATGKENDALYVLDLASRKVVRTIHLPAKPYTVLASKSTPLLYVSLWGGGRIMILDRNSFETVSTVTVGDHPCAMLESSDASRLFVANANNNTVSVVDLKTRTTTETIVTALSPNAPDGSTPNALSLNAAGTRLFVANADNNYVAVIDISSPGSSRSLGFIPTGWYPTTVACVSSPARLLVASAKGLGSRANVGGPNPERRNSHEEYIGSMFSGVVSVLEDPDARQLQTYTAAVYANSPYNDKKKDSPGAGTANAIPSLVGAPSPIKHVFYVIKENRTYDQVFGDMSAGNGDPALCLFPESRTPNHHALAREFVLLDNFYADAEVSADGHNWSMGAYANDYVEKTWPTMYGGRGGEYEYEGGSKIAAPSAGYIWDNCRRHSVSYRTYGEFVNNPEKPGDSATAADPGLVGHVAPFYRAWDMAYSDVQRVRDWMKEFDAYDANGGLPSFQIIKLPNDHTEGTRKGSLTPRAYVAQNDLALGMLVDRISHSRYWKESAIFVIEDDAQNGPDHVDAHRTVALVISPYCRRGTTDSEMYSTSSMVRTMELILGLPALSQFDAAATPMYSSFSSTLDDRPYIARPATVDLSETNIAGAYGQQRSEQMNFTRQDAIPDVELNEIIWKSIRGAASPMPPPVRSAFVRLPEGDRDAD